MIKVNLFIWIGSISLLLSACSIPRLVEKAENRTVPSTYQGSGDTANSGTTGLNMFYADPNLTALIDTALKNNQELNIVLHEMRIAQNEVLSRQGAYLPFVNIGGSTGFDKAARYTRNGSVDEQVPLVPGEKNPPVLTDVTAGAMMSWQVDIWKQLRNAKQSAQYRYLASIEGKNFMVTHLVSEIARSYYELLFLDNQLEILKSYLEIQKNALSMVRLQKMAGEVTELAVKRFEAEVLKNQSRQFYLQQGIIETENRINFLVGRFPQPVKRSAQAFADLVPNQMFAGIPSQLLENRPDVRRAELELAAAKLDVKVARANFYPVLMITANLGVQAFNPKFLFADPGSLVTNLVSNLGAPILNRKAIKAEYASANARQVQAAYNYEQTVLNAFIEVANQLANIDNLAKSYEYQQKQMQALTESIPISTNLFKAARAEYMEVLLTQRDALESQMELAETKKEQLNAMVDLYRALGGGWR
jgi:NodT family efflux transporter outer membrane factor (OMF) lipoprotein